MKVPDTIMLKQVSELKRGQHVKIHLSNIKNMILSYDGINPLVIRKDPELPNVLRVRTLRIISNS